MEYKRCFEVLEIDCGAAPGEVRRAYRDLASVWHPDRFVGNERLSRKAGEKIKEINLAYQTLLAHPLYDRESHRSGDSSTGDRGGVRGADAREGRLEHYAETGTEMALTALARMGRVLLGWVNKPTGGGHYPETRGSTGVGAETAYSAPSSRGRDAAMQGARATAAPDE